MVRNRDAILEEEQELRNQNMTSHAGTLKSPNITVIAFSLIIIIACYQFQKFPREVGKGKVSVAQASIVG